MPVREVIRPRTLQDAIEAAGQAAWRMAAGFTDILPAEVDRKFWQGSPDQRLIDLTGIKALSGISEEAAWLRIGACTTWREIAATGLPAGLAALQLAAREVGSIQIQNRATLGGNLCNASPAADGVPVLMMLDAEVELRSAAGERRQKLTEFILGNRQTTLAPGEILTAILIPRVTAGVPSHFVKVGLRRYMIISLVSVAAAIEVRDGRIADARISVGACSPVPVRLRGLEAALRGLTADGSIISGLNAPEAFAELSPIDDVRATAAYRRRAARVLTTRAVLDLIRRQVN